MVAQVKIGFAKDAHYHIDIQGFNVYHKNRLIKVNFLPWQRSHLTLSMCNIIYLFFIFCISAFLEGLECCREWWPWCYRCLGSKFCRTCTRQAGLWAHYRAIKTRGAISGNAEELLVCSWNLLQLDQLFFCLLDSVDFTTKSINQELKLPVNWLCTKEKFKEIHSAEGCLAIPFNTKWGQDETYQETLS